VRVTIMVVRCGLLPRRGGVDPTEGALDHQRAIRKTDRAPSGPGLRVGRRPATSWLSQEVVAACRVEVWMTSRGASRRQRAPDPVAIGQALSVNDAEGRRQRVRPNVAPFAHGEAFAAKNRVIRGRYRRREPPVRTWETDGLRIWASVLGRSQVRTGRRRR